MTLLNLRPLRRSKSGSGGSFVSDLCLGHFSLLYGSLYLFLCPISDGRVSPEALGPTTSAVLGGLSPPFFRAHSPGPSLRNGENRRQRIEQGERGEDDG